MAAQLTPSCPQVNTKGLFEHHANGVIERIKRIKRSSHTRYFLSAYIFLTTFALLTIKRCGQAEAARGQLFVFGQFP